MNTFDAHRYDTLVRIRDFGAAHTDLFPAGTIAGKAFAAITTAVDQLSAYAATQASRRGTAMEGTTAKGAARDGLREALQTISRTARILALDAPGLDDRFQLPRGSNDHHLLTAARAFVQDAAPLAAGFVAHGLPETFVADLQKTIDAFEAAGHDHSAGRESRIAARAGITALLGDAFTTVERLDVLVTNLLRDDPGLTAAWASVRRVEQPRRADAQPAAGPAPAQHPPTLAPMPMPAPAPAAPPRT